MIVMRFVMMVMMTSSSVIMASISIMIVIFRKNSFLSFIFLDRLYSFFQRKLMDSFSIFYFSTNNDSIQMNYFPQLFAHMLSFTIVQVKYSKKRPVFIFVSIIEIKKILCCLYNYTLLFQLNLKIIKWNEPFICICYSSIFIFTSYSIL